MRLIKHRVAVVAALALPGCGQEPGYCDDLRLELEGDSSLCFAEPEILETTQGRRILQVADVDADGSPDLLLEGPSIAWNNGNRAFSEATPWDVGARNDDIFLAQFDTDPQVELVFVGENPADPSSRVLGVLEVSGERAIEQQRTIGDVARFAIVATADIDGDTDSDVLALDSVGGTLDVWRFDNGMFGLTQLAVDPTVRGDGTAMTIADLTNDGIPDALLESSASSSTTTNAQLFVSVSGGLPVAREPLLPGLGGVHRVFDLSGDGLVDVVGERAFLRGRLGGDFGEEDVTATTFGCLHGTASGKGQQFAYTLVDRNLDSVDGAPCVTAFSLAPGSGPNAALDEGLSIEHPELSVFNSPDQATTCGETLVRFVDLDVDGRVDIVNPAPISYADSLDAIFYGSLCD
jgi:hypothetical protein